eukprot:TRINITY_DN57738_c0_g1_i1.p1 TRINITY_DN57738_c0_g1~~TRINITY_DN57738_c0_g1_i1.p1  ORF type:complete len:304 (+),score=33.61 TRINITY_DN57738_c0_g1_i1:122-1033(+)
MAAAPALLSPDKIEKLLTQAISDRNAMLAHLQKLMNLEPFYAKIDEFTDTAFEQFQLNTKDIIDKSTKARRILDDALLEGYSLVYLTKQEFEMGKEILAECTTIEEKLQTALEMFGKQSKELLKQYTTTMNKFTAAIVEFDYIPGLLHTTKQELKTKIEDVKREVEREIKKKRELGYGLAALGAIGGPAGLVISYSIAAGVTEGDLIPHIEKNGKARQKQMQGLQDECATIHKDTTQLKDTITKEKQSLNDVAQEVKAVSAAVSKSQAKGLPSTLFQPVLNVVVKRVDTAIAASDKYLQARKR